MTIKKEIQVRDFDFWMDAKTIAEVLTETEWDIIESELEAAFPDGLSECELNDLFWFNADKIAALIGETEESLLERKKEE